MSPNLFTALHVYVPLREDDDIVTVKVLVLPLWLIVKPFVPLSMILEPRLHVIFAAGNASTVQTNCTGGELPPTSAPTCVDDGSFVVMTGASEKREKV